MSTFLCSSGPTQQQGSSRGWGRPGAGHARITLNSAPCRPVCPFLLGLGLILAWRGHGRAGSMDTLSPLTARISANARMSTNIPVSHILIPCVNGPWSTLSPNDYRRESLMDPLRRKLFGPSSLKVFNCRMSRATFFSSYALTSRWSSSAAERSFSPRTMCTGPLSPGVGAQLRKIHRQRPRPSRRIWREIHMATDMGEHIWGK